MPHRRRRRNTQGRPPTNGSRTGRRARVRRRPDSSNPRVHSTSAVLERTIHRGDRTIFKSHRTKRHGSRTGRQSKCLLEIADCTTAIADSRQALALPPFTLPQYHTDAEANDTLAACYYQKGEFQPALQHADAAQQIMQEHGYPAEDIETLETLEGTIRSAMSP